MQKCNFLSLIIICCFPFYAHGQLNSFICDFPDEVFLFDGNSPVCTAVGDLDSDGDNDAVVVLDGTEEFVVLLNSGIGEYSMAGAFATESNPRALTINDLDADGDLDLAVVNSGPGTLTLFLNEGDGTFVNVSSQPTGGTSNTVRSADLDSDGDVDLVVSNNGTGGIAVFLNDGNASFGPFENFGVLGFPVDVALSDLDNDGDIDIGTANRFGQDFSVLLNNGDGSFAEDISFAVGPFPSAIAMTDLDNDGDVDVAVASSSTEEVFVYFNEGNASFILDQTHPSPDLTDYLEAGDFDGDQIPDLVAGASTFGGGYRIYLNSGSGDLSDTVGVGGGCCGVAGFIDGDQSLDLLSVEVVSSQDVGVRVAKNPAAGQPIQALDFSSMMQDVVAGDIDGDSDIDVVARVFPNQIAVFRNDDQGNYSVPVFLPIAGRKLTLADFDNDNDLDLATTDFFESNLRIVFNDGLGNFGNTQLIPVDTVSLEIASGDINGDGNADIVASSFVFDNLLMVLFGNGDGSFEVQESIIHPPDVGIALVDFDLDSDLDIVSSGSEVLVLENDGAGTFAAAIELPSQGVSPVVGDIDGDEDIDLVFLNPQDGSVATQLNDGTGDFQSGPSISNAFNLGVVGASMRRLADIDRDEDLDLVALINGLLIVVPNDGTGQFQNASTYAIDGGSNSFVIADIDSDQDNDIISIGLGAQVTRNQCTLLGDINGDGNVDLLDVAPFVDLLASGQYQFEADINQDGSVDLLDVAGFVGLLNG